MGQESRKPRRQSIISMAVIGVIASILGIAAGLAIDWFPAQGSTQAKDIDTLWDVLIICSVPMFVLVTVVVLFSVREWREKPGEEATDGPPIHGNTRLEVIWTAAPAIMLVSLCTYAAIVLGDIEEAPAGNEARVAVTGEQFTWTFEYTGSDGTKFSTNQLYVEEGKSVRFDVKSKDVLHDFWVPEWRMKIDAVPGITTGFRITPTKTGVFPVVCAELCGLGHAFMRQSAHVLPSDKFATWMDQQVARVKEGGSDAGSGGGAPADGGAPDDAEPGGDSGGGAAAADGKAIFDDPANACASCHTLADAGSNGQTGPNLDEVLPGQSVDEVRTSIVDPKAQITDGFPDVMPTNYGDTLTPAQIDALVTYLTTATAK